MITLRHIIFEVGTLRSAVACNSHPRSVHVGFRQLDLAQRTFTIHSLDGSPKNLVSALIGRGLVDSRLPPFRFEKFWFSGSQLAL